MSSLIDSILLTTPTRPFIIGLAIFTVALFAAFALEAASIANHHFESEYDEDFETNNNDNDNTILPSFTPQETCPLLRLDTSNCIGSYYQDPLKDFPHGRYDCVSPPRIAKSHERATKSQRLNGEPGRRTLQADGAGSMYGTIAGVAALNGKKRKVGDEIETEGKGRGKRVRVGRDEGEYESAWVFY